MNILRFKETKKEVSKIPCSSCGEEVERVITYRKARCLRCKRIRQASEYYLSKLSSTREIADKINDTHAEMQRVIKDLQKTSTNSPLYTTLKMSHDMFKDALAQLEAERVITTK